MLTKGGADTKISSGTYIGNGTQNRAVPHKLDVKPKVVLGMEHTTADVMFMTVHDMARTIYDYTGTVASYAVTEADKVNIYVGSPTPFYGNVNARTYTWVAIA